MIRQCCLGNVLVSSSWTGFFIRYLTLHDITTHDKISQAFSSVRSNKGLRMRQLCICTAFWLPLVQGWFGYVWSSWWCLTSSPNAFHSSSMGILFYTQECVECEPNVFYSLLPAVYKQVRHSRYEAPFIVNSYGIVISSSLVPRPVWTIEKPVWDRSYYS